MTSGTGGTEAHTGLDFITNPSRMVAENNEPFHAHLDVLRKSAAPEDESSRIFMDRTVLEQQREIESLKLRLFWCDYSKDVFKNTMWEFNFLRTQCGCINCVCRGSVDEEDFQNGRWRSRNTFRCVWQDAFQRELKERGLTFQVIHRLGNSSPDHQMIRGFDYYPEADCHFVVHGERNDWVAMGLGSLLGGANHECDAELQKYKKLVDDFVNEYDES